MGVYNDIGKTYNKNQFFLLKSFTFGYTTIYLKKILLKINIS